MTNIHEAGIFDIIRTFLFGSTWTKTIVCLAASRKYSGYCVAGREMVEGVCGEWVRPVSRKKFSELTPDIMRLKSGGVPGLLDIVEVPLVRPVPCTYQSENCLVDESRKWKITGSFTAEALSGICDAVETLWVNGYSSSQGVNDRVPVKTAERECASSLLLVRPEHLSFLVSDDSAGRRKLRAHFVYRDVTYRIVVTDPSVETLYFRKINGRYPVSSRNVYLCVSLSEPYEGYVYKLAASVITAL